VSWPTLRYYRVLGLRNAPQLVLQVALDHTTLVWVTDDTAAVSYTLSRTDAAARLRAWRKAGATITRIRELL
jgi:hypothetical protein